MITEGKRKQVSPGPLRPQLWHSPNSRHSRQPGLFQGEGKDQGSGLFVYRYVHVNPKPWRSCAATESSSLLPPPPPVDKGGGGARKRLRSGRERSREGRVEERWWPPKPLQVDQTSGPGACSRAPHPAAPLGRPGLAFPNPPLRRLPERQAAGPGAEVTLKLLGKNRRYLWLHREGGRLGAAAGAGGGPGRTGGGPGSGEEPRAMAVRGDVPPVPRWRRCF